MINTLRKNLFSVISLASLFLIALAIRVINLSKYPVGFQIDEAILGYTGYSILKTFKDTNGVFLPLYTEVFGDYIPTGYHFLTVPLIILFGLSEFSTRLPAAVFGSLSVISIFFLSYSLFRNKYISLISSFLLCFSPWSIILSRGSSESIVALFFVLTGFAFYFESLRVSKLYFLLIGSFFLISSFFVYHTPRLFVPLLLICVFIYLFKNIKSYKNKIFKKLVIASLILILGVVVLLTLSFKGSTSRFNQVSIFSFPENKLVLEEQIREDGVLNIDTKTVRVFHNKIMNNTLSFLSNYSEYFSFNTLFMKPGLPKMFSIPNIGLIYLFLLPFFIYGLLKIITSKEKFYKVAIIWILISPITAALTIDDIPNMRRSSVLLPMVEIISSYGLYSSFLLLKKYPAKIKYLVLLSFFFIVLWNIAYFFHQYFIHASVHQTWYRNNGFSKMMEVVNMQYNNYDKIIVTKSNGGYPLILFYSKYNPMKYISEGSPKDKDFKGFGKFIFIPSDCPSLNNTLNIPKNEKILVVDGGTCKIPKYKEKYMNIYKEDGSLAFRIIF